MQILKLIYLLEKHVNILEFCIISLSIIPTLLHSVMPFGVLIASLYSYNNLKANKELVVMESLGMSHKDLLKPSFKLCFIIFIISMFNSAYLMPKTQRYLKDELHRQKNSLVFGSIQEGVFNNFSNKLILFVDKKLSGNKYSNIYLFDRRKWSSWFFYSAELAEIKFENDKVLISFSNGIRQPYTSYGEDQAMKFDKFTLNILDKNIEDRPFHRRNVYELYLWELLLYKNYTDDRSPKYLAEAHNRISWPFMNLILPMIALISFLKSDFNRKDYVKNIVKSFMVSIIFIISHFAFYALGQKDNNLIILMYVNLLLAALFAISLLNSHKNYLTRIFR